MESKVTNELIDTTPTVGRADAVDEVAATTTEPSLSAFIERNVRQYFKALGDEVPSNLYEVMLHQLEKPLLTVVLEQTRGNQTRTAEILGLNRGTLRKKLKTHHLM